MYVLNDGGQVHRVECYYVRNCGGRAHRVESYYEIEKADASKFVGEAGVEYAGGRSCGPEVCASSGRRIRSAICCHLAENFMWWQFIPP